MGNGCEAKVREARGTGGEISKYKITNTQIRKITIRKYCEDPKEEG